MDMHLYPLWCVGWNYVSIPKLQRCNRRCLRFHRTFYGARDYLSRLGFKVNNVCIRDHFGSRSCSFKSITINIMFCHMTMDARKLSLVHMCISYKYSQRIGATNIACNNNFLQHIYIHIYSYMKDGDLLLFDGTVIPSKILQRSRWIRICHTDFLPSLYESVLY